MRTQRQASRSNATRDGLRGTEERVGAAAAGGGSVPWNEEMEITRPSYLLLTCDAASQQTWEKTGGNKRK